MNGTLQDLTRAVRSRNAAPLEINIPLRYNLQTITFEGLATGGGAAYPQLDLVGQYVFTENVEVIALLLSSAMLVATMPICVAALARKGGPILDISKAPDVFLTHVALQNSLVTATPTCKSTGIELENDRFILHQGDALAIYASDNLGAGDAYSGFATAYYRRIFLNGSSL